MESTGKGFELEISVIDPRKKIRSGLNANVEIITHENIGQEKRR